MVSLKKRIGAHRLPNQAIRANSVEHGVIFLYQLYRVYASPFAKYFALESQLVFRGTVMASRALIYSTVTDFARLRGWSTSVPRSTAI